MMIALLAKWWEYGLRFEVICEGWSGGGGFEVWWMNHAFKIEFGMSRGQQRPFPLGSFVPVWKDGWAV